MTLYVRLQKKIPPGIIYLFLLSPFSVTQLAVNNIKSYKFSYSIKTTHIIILFIFFLLHLTDARYHVRGFALNEVVNCRKTR